MPEISDAENRRRGLFDPVRQSHRRHMVIRDLSSALDHLGRAHDYLREAQAEAIRAGEPRWARSIGQEADLLVTDGFMIDGKRQMLALRMRASGLWGPGW